MIRYMIRVCFFCTNLCMPHFYVCPEIGKRRLGCWRIDRLTEFRVFVFYVLLFVDFFCRYCRLSGGMAVANDLDQLQRNVVVNAYEAKHAGSIEEGSEGEAEQRAKVASDLGKSTVGVMVVPALMKLFVSNVAGVGFCPAAVA